MKGLYEKHMKKRKMMKTRKEEMNKRLGENKYTSELKGCR